MNIPGLSTLPPASALADGEIANLHQIRSQNAQAKTPAERLASLERAAERFEAIFVRMLLQEMRNTVPRTSLLGSDSSEQEIYEGMLDSALADRLASTRGLGIADMVVREFRDQVEAGVPAGGPEADWENTARFLANREALRADNR